MGSREVSLFSVMVPGRVKKSVPVQGLWGSYSSGTGTIGHLCFCIIYYWYYSIYSLEVFNGSSNFYVIIYVMCLVIGPVTCS